jgi:peroxiredoxin
MWKRLALSSAIVVAVAAAACGSDPDKAAAGHTGDDYAARPRAALVGKPLPAAALDLLDGGTVALADVLGTRPIYLKFWATWCKPCREQMPHFEGIHATYGERLAMFGVALGVNDPVETIRAFRDEHALKVPVAVDRDGAVGELLQVAVTPQHIVVDRAGIVRYVGHAVTPELDAAIAEVARADAPPTTPPPRVAPADPSAATAPLALALADGTSFTLAAHAGAPIALTFVQTWCDTYLAETRPAIAQACLAHARAAEAQRRAHPRVTWVTVVHPVWTDAGALEPFRTRTSLGAPLGIDERGAWFHRFTVRETATTIVLDATGAEVGRATGAGDDLAAILARLP